MYIRTRRKPRLRKVYLLPNLFTAFNLFLGIYALVSVLDQDLDRACWAIFLAGLLDGLDGAVARLTHTQSAFGLEFDSLSDLVSFGVAPAMAMLLLMERLGATSHRIAIGTCALYAICGALRLARYNIQAHGEERKAFLGLPIPGGAAVLIFTVLVILEYTNEISSAVLPLGFGHSVELTHVIGAVLPFLVIGSAILMVSEVPYPSIIRKIRLQRRMPFESLVSLICVGLLLVALKSDMRVLLLFCMTLVYITYGFGHFFVDRLQQRRHPSAEEPPEPPIPDSAPLRR